MDEDLFDPDRIEKRWKERAAERERKLGRSTPASQHQPSRAAVEARAPEPVAPPSTTIKAGVFTGVRRGLWSMKDDLVAFAVLVVAGLFLDALYHSTPRGLHRLVPFAWAILIYAMVLATRWMRK